MSRKFPAKVPRSTKKTRGRTSVESTPISIRGDGPVLPEARDRMRKKLARRIGHAAPMIERGTIRFEDINGPRGGVDKICRIKLVLSGHRSIQAEERGVSVEPAFERASSKVQQALEQVRRKRASTRRGVAASSQRPDSAPERAPMKLKTARRAPSKKAVKSKAPATKQRSHVQRAGRR
jgi:hypothetical protein